MTMEMDQETRKKLLEQYEKEGPCAHCGGLHLIACPRVREFRFHPDGRIASVKFWREWPKDGIIWYEDLVGDGDDEEPG